MEQRKSLSLKDDVNEEEEGNVVGAMNGILDGEEEDVLDGTEETVLVGSEDGNFDVSTKKQ